MPKAGAMDPFELKLDPLRGDEIGARNAQGVT